MAVEDVRNAADLFRELYDESDGRHGFVSLQVSPRLAHDTEATIDEARQIWEALDRPNVLIKVPDSREGLPTIRHPEYSDVKYVEELIGPDTVNTVPSDTLDAYRDRGRLEARLE